MSPYVIVRPGDKGHAASDPAAHLVVDVTEWVAVALGDKPGYDFVTEHPDFDHAHNERNRLNGTGGQVTVTEPVEQPENPVETTQGVRWLGEKAIA